MTEPLASMTPDLILAELHAAEDDRIGSNDWQEAIQSILDAIPDGWAKLNGKWVRLMQVDQSCEDHWHIAAEGA